MNTSKQLNWTMAKYKFDQYFGDVGALSLWAEEIVNKFKINPAYSFNALALEALDSIAKERGIKLIDIEKSSILNILNQLSAFELIENHTIRKCA